MGGACREVRRPAAAAAGRRWDAPKRPGYRRSNEFVLKIIQTDPNEQAQGFCPPPTAAAQQDFAAADGLDNDTASDTAGDTLEGCGTSLSLPGSGGIAKSEDGGFWRVAIQLNDGLCVGALSLTGSGGLWRVAVQLLNDGLCVGVLSLTGSGGIVCGMPRTMTTARKSGGARVEAQEEDEEEEQEEYEVEAIQDRRVRKGKLEYLVLWRGYPASQATWEPEANLEGTDADHKMGAFVPEPASDDDETSEGEYEVELIRDRRVRKGTVEYLVLWKGWAADESTWEPQDNLKHARDQIELFRRTSAKSSAKSRRGGGKTSPGPARRSGGGGSSGASCSIAATATAPAPPSAAAAAAAGPAGAPEAASKPASRKRASAEQSAAAAEPARSSGGDDADVSEEQVAQRASKRQRRPVERHPGMIDSLDKATLRFHDAVAAPANSSAAAAAAAAPAAVSALSAESGHGGTKRQGRAAGTDAELSRK